ncbi:hypothetical protein ACJJTC_009879 [Scirpophaga incertulas]
MKMFARYLLEIVFLSAIGRTMESIYKDPNNITTCEEFERGARFNPYEIVDSMWKIFYFWGNTTELYPIAFSISSKKKLDKLKPLIDAVDGTLEVEWSKATFLMEPRPGVLVVFLYAGTPGAFRALVKMDRRTKERPFPLPLVKFADIRIKIMGRYVVMMCCEDMTAYAFARLNEMPSTEQDCATESSKLHINLPNAHSYLYVHRLFDEL